MDWTKTFQLAHSFAERQMDGTLSQEPEIRISWSPVPGFLSQNAILVTGPVWPLYICKVFPDWARSLGPWGENDALQTENADLQVRFTNDSGIVCDPCHVIPNFDGQCLPWKLDRITECLYPFSLLLSGLYIDVGSKGQEYTSQTSQTRTCSIRSWASATTKLSVLMIRLEYAWLPGG